MSDRDIVEYLRAGHNTQHNCKKAADEIERLRGVLRDINDNYDLHPKAQAAIDAALADAADSAEDGTKHHPNCTPPCGICEPDEWEKQFLASGVDPVDGI